jgi:DNA polymerase-3 subunit gamma/tau
MQQAGASSTGPVSAAVDDGGGAVGRLKPFPVATSQSAGFAEGITEGALARAPETDSTQVALEPAALRQTVCDALSEAGHVSASQLLGSGVWTQDGASLRIEVAGMGKKMLSLTFSAAAERVIRQELQRLGLAARFLIVPGAGAVQVVNSMAAPPAGSIHEVALQHPLVQRAQEIFNAEIRSVVDLRFK